MSETASLRFDVRDPAFLADPYPVFDQLRATAPVWKAPFGRCFLTRYDDCNLLLRDRRFGKDYANGDALIRRFGPTALQEPAVVELSNMMLMRDPPDHTRLRGLYQGLHRPAHRSPAGACAGDGRSACRQGCGAGADGRDPGSGVPAAGTGHL
jgi:cytochrome P450